MTDYKIKNSTLIHKTLDTHLLFALRQMVVLLPKVEEEYNSMKFFLPTTFNLDRESEGTLENVANYENDIIISEMLEGYYIEQDVYGRSRMSGKLFAVWMFMFYSESIHNRFQAGGWMEHEEEFDMYADFRTMKPVEVIDLYFEQIGFIISQAQETLGIKK